MKFQTVLPKTTEIWECSFYPKIPPTVFKSQHGFVYLSSFAKANFQHAAGPRPGGCVTSERAGSYEGGRSWGCGPWESSPFPPMYILPVGSHPSTWAPGDGHPHPTPAPAWREEEGAFPQSARAITDRLPGARHCARPLEIPHGTQGNGNPCSLYR